MFFKQWCKAVFWELVTFLSKKISILFKNRFSNILHKMGKIKTGQLLIENLSPLLNIEVSLPSFRSEGKILFEKINLLVVLEDSKSAWRHFFTIHILLGCRRVWNCLCTCTLVGRPEAFRTFLWKVTGSLGVRIELVGLDNPTTVDGWIVCCWDCSLELTVAARQLTMCRTSCFLPCHASWWIYLGQTYWSLVNWFYIW